MVHQPLWVLSLPLPEQLKLSLLLLLQLHDAALVLPLLLQEVLLLLCIGRRRRRGRGCCQGRRCSGAAAVHPSPFPLRPSRVPQVLVVLVVVAAVVVLRGLLPPVSRGRVQAVPAPHRRWVRPLPLLLLLRRLVRCATVLWLWLLRCLR